MIPMSNFNQLRQNVRNYCVGLTCEEIRREIAIDVKRLETYKFTHNYNYEQQRLSYFQEYLAELEKENNDARTNSKG